MDTADSNDMDVDHDPIPTSISWVAPPSQLEASFTGVYEVSPDAGGIWVMYRWKTSNPNARIEPFYNRWPPSRTSSRACGWIGVDCGLSPLISNLTPGEFGSKFRRDVHGLKTEFEAIVRGGGAGITPELIDALAIKYGVLSGKWAIHCGSDTIDQLWRRVVRVVAFDRGYGQLKVSPRKVLDDGSHNHPHCGESMGDWDGGIPNPEEGHVICVYVDDYTNKGEVDELRRALRFGAKVYWKIGFKPDAYTWLGIYRGNEWGIRPSRYHDSDNQGSCRKE